MKLKYYLRGLGIGIAVTALLMGFAGSEHAATATQTASSGQTLKENDITEQVTTDVLEPLSEEISMTQIMTEETDNSETEEVISTETDSTESVTEEQTEPSSEDLVDKEAEKIQEKASAMQDEAEQIKSEGEQMKSDILETGSKVAESDSETSSSSSISSSSKPVAVVVNSGDGSGTVARKLELAGLIENASEFDAYLMQHGYDKKITVGSHTVTPGSSWNEIAQQITN